MFLLKIFHEFHLLDPNSALVLCGSGELEDKIKEEIHKLSLSDAVLLLGNRSDMPNVYQAFDLFLFPSLFEGLPFALIEAQAAGIPCLISDTISREVSITSDRIHYCSLNSSSKIWAEKLFDLKEFKKKNTKEEIIASGYEINSNISGTLNKILNENDR